MPVTTTTLNLYEDLSKAYLSTLKASAGSMDPTISPSRMMSNELSMYHGGAPSLCYPWYMKGI